LQKDGIEFCYDSFLAYYLPGITLDYRTDYYGRKDFSIYGLGDCS